MEKKITLYSIGQDLFNLTQQIQVNNGEISENEEIILKELSMQLETKIDGVIDFFKHQNSYIDEIKRRKQELAELEKIEKNRLESFKKYVIKCMGMIGETKIKGQYGHVSLRKPSKKLIITDDTKIPLDFIETVETVKIDSMGIKTAIKNGEVIEGAELIDGEQGLMVK